MKVPLFKRYVEHGQHPSRFAAFDLETVGLDGAIVGVGWQVEGEDAPHIGDDPQHLVRAMLSRKRSTVTS